MPATASTLHSSTVVAGVEWGSERQRAKGRRRKEMEQRETEMEVWRKEWRVAQAVTIRPVTERLRPPGWRAGRSFGAVSQDGWVALGMERDRAREREKWGREGSNGEQSTADGGGSGTGSVMASPSAPASREQRGKGREEKEEGKGQLVGLGSVRRRQGRSAPLQASASAVPSSSFARCLVAAGIYGHGEAVRRWRYFLTAMTELQLDRHDVAIGSARSSGLGDFGDATQWGRAARRELASTG